MGFGQKLKKLTLSKKNAIGKSTKEEQNGNFAATSSEELWVQKLQMYARGKGRHTHMIVHECLCVQNASEIA